MEGLIPFIYKTIKERRSRSYYKCLSTGMAQFDGAAAADEREQRQWLVVDAARSPGAPRSTEQECFHGNGLPAQLHRRHRSLEDFPGEAAFSPDGRRRRLAKARSVRIFSCMGGM